MSVSITYHPAREKEYFNSGVSSDVTALEETFGNFPLSLSREDVPVLQAMARASDRDIYKEIIEAIELHGQIIMSTEY